MELLQVADAVAREKGIDRDEVLTAMEQAIQKAGRSKYGHEHDIRANIDRKNGEIRLTRVREVVETVENEATQIPVNWAQKRDPLHRGQHLVAIDALLTGHRIGDLQQFHARNGNGLFHDSLPQSSFCSVSCSVSCSRA